MATEDSPLLIHRTTIQSQSDFVDSEEAKSIKQVLIDIKAGKVRVGRVLIYTLLVVIGSFQIGCVLGYSSLTQISLSQSPNDTNKPSHVDTGFTLSNNQYSFFGAAASLTALIAGLFSGVLSDRIGRKPSMLFGCVPLVFGWSAMGISYYFIGPGDEMKFYILIMVGRSLTGFGMGCLSLVVPTYIVEVAPTSLKGLLGASHQLLITIGILSVYLLGSYIRYHIVALTVCAISVAYAVGILFLPETPRWLLVNGEDELAMNELRRLRGHTTNINNEMQSLRDSLKNEEISTFAQKLMEFKKGPVIIALMLSLALMFFQQFCGINAIIFYGADITASANVPKPETSFSLGVGLMQVFVTFIGVLLVDLAGRKKLLVFGGVFLFLGTFTLGLCYFLCPKTTTHHYCHHLSYLSLVGLVIFITGFSIGWGAIPWLMMSELAPLKVRGIMGGIATAVNWSFSTIVTLFFSQYQHLVHPYGAWWTFAGVTLISIPFVIILLPETKGKTLEEIREGLNRYKIVRRN